MRALGAKCADLVAGIRWDMYVYEMRFGEVVSQGIDWSRAGQGIQYLHPHN